MHEPKLILVIMDGWGYSPIKAGNAVFQAKTPNFDSIWSNYSHTLLNSFGENVGLPWGSIGSSEVGHASIGSGRLVNQELSRIDKEIANGSFYTNEKILSIISKIEKSNHPIHLIGLVSNGGVHSNLEHLYSLLKILKVRKFKQDIFIHAITDGRDTSPTSALQYVDELEKKIRRIGVHAKIATLSGRFYAMDRDNRWERTKQAYLAMTESEGTHVTSPKEAIEASYKKKVTDEFFEPVVIDLQEKTGLFSKLLKKQPSAPKTGKVNDGDGLIFFNIRPDRMRQLSEMFLFERKDQKTSPKKNLKVLTLTTYNEYLPVEVAYPSEVFKNPLAKIFSDHGIKQGHFAETEKYAHVTYFFNGGNASPFKGETWNLVPSPKVLTYDKTPEMSAEKITDKVFSTVDKEKLDFVLINYANADMVGHTGKFQKVIEAVESVDQQLGRLAKRYPNSTMIITADHGNAECMIHPETGEIDKKHSVNPVPFVLINEKFKKITAKGSGIPSATGILADIAPTILYFYDIKPDPEMTGISLINSLK